MRGSLIVVGFFALGCLLGANPLLLNHAQGLAPKFDNMVVIKFRPLALKIDGAQGRGIRRLLVKAPHLSAPSIESLGLYLLSQANNCGKRHPKQFDHLSSTPLTA